jgi:thioredoxin-related protein
MQKVTGFLIIVVLFFISVSFIPKNKEKVQWLTVAQLQEAYSKNPKPILVDVYTNWCGWCKVMDRQTYSNEKVVSYINEHYYAVKLDAEQKDSLVWNGKKYGYSKLNKVNELAVYLCYGQLSFPTTVFVADMKAQPAPLAGYLKASEIEPPLKFFGENAYKTQNFQDFNKAFSNSW